MHFILKTGDGIIDHEEFEYVLSEFGVSERTARQAFNMCTMVGQIFVCLLIRVVITDYTLPTS